MIREMASDADIASAFAVMRQLRPHLREVDFLPTIRRMRGTDGYRLAAFVEDGGPACVAGFRLGENLARGKYLYVDDLVTAETARSRGLGKAMLEWLAERARKAGCAALILDSGVQRFAAHRFYLRERFDIVCHHFLKPL
jgi:GNAT superfamily N-acetyltransferase